MPHTQPHNAGTEVSQKDRFLLLKVKVILTSGPRASELEGHWVSACLGLSLLSQREGPDSCPAPLASWNQRCRHPGHAPTWAGPGPHPAGVVPYPGLPSIVGSAGSKDRKAGRPWAGWFLQAHLKPAAAWGLPPPPASQSCQEPDVALEVPSVLSSTSGRIINLRHSVWGNKTHKRKWPQILLSAP